MSDKRPAVNLLEWHNLWSDYYKPDKLIEWADKARNLGYIQRGALERILAEDYKYHNDISRLWTYYKLPGKPFDLSEMSAREHAWTFLLQHFTRSSVGPFFGKRPGLDDELLTVYERNKLTGEFRLYDPAAEHKFGYGGVFYELSGVKKCFTETLNLQLPSRLFEEVKESEAPDSHETDEGQTDPIEVIKSLRFSADSTDEIIIQRSGRKKKSYRAADLGFRNETTKEWKTLLRIIGTPGFKYYIGPSGRLRHPEQQYPEDDRVNFSEDSSQEKPSHSHQKEVAPSHSRSLEYDRRQSMLKALDRKLMNFFEREYGLGVDDKVKCYELCVGEPGTYRFIFQHGNQEISLPDYETFTVEQMKAEVNKLLEILTNGKDPREVNQARTKVNLLHDAAKRKKCLNRVFSSRENFDGEDQEATRDAAYEEEEVLE